MSSIVIASTDAVCQSLKSWLVAKNVAKDSQALSDLKDGDTLWIVGHDTELGDGTAMCAYFTKSGIPKGVNYSVYLIVCSAQSLDFTKGIITPAELIANTLNLSVWASTTVVVGKWDQNGAIFTGTFKKIAPKSDVLSQFEALKI